MITSKFLIIVNNEEFKWWVSRQPQWCHEDGWQGVQISVELSKNPRKLPLIQLPFKAVARRSTPHKQRPKIQPAQVIEYITSAIETGWQPNSFGKPFHYYVT